MKCKLLTLAKFLTHFRVVENAKLETATMVLVLYVLAWK